MVDEGAFDIIILGTGLTESIAAAALSKAGFKVAHIDRNPYYGAKEASLSFDELIQWQDTPQPGFSAFSRSSDTVAQPRTYALSLAPSLIPSTGPLIEALVASGVAKYGGFRLIERVCVYVSGAVKPVPGSKEDVFKNKEISLVDKRRLMRFLMFAAGEFEGKMELTGHEEAPFPQYLKSVFSLNDEMVNAIAYALAYCLSPSEPALPALHRLRRYLLSAGRYGANPFLVGHYGSAGEIAQGFCRTAAVGGAVYILGRDVESVSASAPRHTVRLTDFPDPLSCALLISSPAYAPPGVPRPTPVLPPPSASAPFSAASLTYPVARGIAIIDRALALGPSAVQVPAEPSEDAPTASLPPALDTAVLVFPPSSLPGGSATAAATVLLTGEGTMSCPHGKWILYLALPLPDSDSTGAPADLNPETLLKPYLDATLALATPDGEAPGPLTPLFSTFYLQHAPTHSDPESTPSQDERESAPSPAQDASAPPPAHLAPAPLPPVLALPDAGDAAALHAEAVFWAAVKLLRPDSDQDAEGAITGLWPPMEERGEDEDD
ncbi:GDP dissociation inhibitor-domain-containing protein [Mycena rosella]|uniref:GDP dissociation inhibitor-domain-containing protein n=1 Tax=Mycena rosella TaxID=1033263 RepID=A0AAD7DTW5_MYCRO|nr:GDP dissociation inhibitor-domain-containing protein [Mycena rosella]